MAIDHIGIIGWYGHGNVGDEALLKTVYSQVRSQLPSADITVFSDVPEAVSAYGFETAPTLPLSPRSWLKAPARAMQALRAWGRQDLLVLGGGGFFADDVSLRNVVKWTITITLARLAGTRVAAYAIGVGPLNSPLSRILARLAFGRMDLVTVRDDESRRWLQKSGIANVHVTADPVVSWSADVPDGAAILEQFGIPTTRPLVAICIPPFFHDAQRWPHHEAQWQNFRQCWVQAIDALVGLGVTPVFLPMQHSPSHYKLYSDVDLAEELVAASRVPDASFVIKAPLAPESVAAILGKMGLVLGMRLHALILAALMGVPMAGVLYHHKACCLVERLGLTDEFVDVHELEPEAFVQLVRTAWARRAAIKSQLDAAFEPLRAESRRTETLFGQTFAEVTP